jgi:LuxR family quorum sensing-dependent transcriptional regulator
MSFVTEQAVRFSQDLDSVKSLAELGAFIRARLGLLNIGYFSFYEPAKTKGAEIKGVHIHNLPEDWLRYYLDMDYDAVSPILRKLNRTRAPFFWKTLEPEGYLDLKLSRQMLRESAAAGLGDGYSCPIVHANGDMVVFNLVTDHLEDDPRLPPSIQLISLFVHEKYRSLQDVNGPRPLPNLTQRERDCLSWAAEGKTNWEIGEILTISEASVRTYLKRAKQKLGVTTKVQAIVRATHHRLIRN